MPDTPTPFVDAGTLINSAEQMFGSNTDISDTKFDEVVDKLTKHQLEIDNCKESADMVLHIQSVIRSELRWALKKLGVRILPESNADTGFQERVSHIARNNVRIAMGQEPLPEEEFVTYH